jgi:hypothetical protein
MAFDADDKPVLNVGQKGGVRLYDSLSKAKNQRTRWRNGVRWNGGQRRYHHYPNAKVFRLVYVAGVLMTTEVDCEQPVQA